MSRKRAIAAFQEHFGTRPAIVASAPGRVNLIGEHTDYNDGFVLPLAIPYHVSVAAAPATGGSIEVLAADMGRTTDRFPASSDLGWAGDWRDHVRGAVSMFGDAGHEVPACRLAIAGDVPQGAGLSSSAALGVAMIGALARLAHVDLDHDTIARLAQSAENDFVGAPCGIMDQLVSVGASEGSAIFLDCRSLETEPVALPDDTAVLIVDSGVTHSIVDSHYSDRRAACDRAATALGVPALRDAHVEAVEDSTDLTPLDRRRALHVVTENARVIAARRALADGDLAAMGELMRASHASMRDDFEITTPEVDRLTDIMNEAIGTAGGARMTGGGFGGCVVALMPTADIEAVQAATAHDYRTPDDDPPRQFLVQPARGLTIDTLA
ncbi:MAG: galactokinase [Pseudomonadota bacterium]